MTTRCQACEQPAEQGTLCNVCAEALEEAWRCGDEDAGKQLDRAGKLHPCWQCEGTGDVLRTPLSTPWDLARCPACGGTGEVRHAEMVAA